VYLRNFPSGERQLERTAVGFGELKVEQAEIRGLGSGAHGRPTHWPALNEKHIRGIFPGATCAMGVPDGFAALTAGDPDDLGRYVRRSPTQCTQTGFEATIPSRASMCTL
jgi:hypothetical protein